VIESVIFLCPFYRSRSP